MPGKRIKFDPDDWMALDQLARERHVTLQQLADEAFRDVLEKYGRTVTKAPPQKTATVIRFPKTPRAKRKR
jgi:hypothetical protein